MRRRGRPGLLGMAARTAVVAGTANAVSSSMNSRRAQSEQEAAQAAAYRQSQQPPAQYAAPPPQHSAAPTVDLVSQLERLAALKQQGILTDQEFADQKARLLRL
ncbi:MAG: SHOCT domain-containing protein [Ornithinimicrobium sp.]